MYGYTFREIDPNTLNIDKGRIKKSLIIGRCRIKDSLERTRKPVSVSLPIHFDFALPRPDRDDPENVVLAQLKRVGTQTPTPHSAILKALEIFTDSFCEQYLRPLEPGEAEFEDWIEQVNQPESRKKEIREAWEAAPYDDPSQVFKATEVKGFLKDESNGDYKAARGINARCDWFKAHSGPIFDAISKQVFALPWFIKKIPVSDRPAAILAKLFSNIAKTLNCDASSYEAHFEAMVMRAIEFRLYLFMTRLVVAYARRMAYIMEVLSGVQNIRYKFFDVIIEGIRCSGEMNTSLGNGFTTVILNLFIALLRKTFVDLFAEGDDNLSHWIEDFKAPTARDWEILGWIMKVETPRDPAEASFCGNIFASMEEIVITDPRPALANFGWTNSKYTKANRSTRLQLLRAKALSMLHQYNGCPLLSAFGRRVEFLTRSVRIRQSIVNNMEQYKRTILQDAIKAGIPEAIIPGPDTRDLVEYLYGIPVPEQLSFEKACAELELDTVISFPMVQPLHWSTHYADYTCPTNEEWSCPRGQDPERLRLFISAFGRTTRRFVNSYYSIDVR